MMAFLGANRKQRFTTNPLHSTTETLGGMSEKHNMFRFFREYDMFNVQLKADNHSETEKSPCRSPELSECISDCSHFTVAPVY